MPVEFDAEIAINEVTLQADSDISTPGVGDTSYLSLTEKPQINGVTLVGNKSTEELNIDHVLVADNLSAHSGTTDTTPYTLRSAPSYAGSVAELRKIVGGTVGWNQLVQNGDFADGTNKWNPIQSSNGVTASVSNGVFTYTVTDNTKSTRPNISQKASDNASLAVNANHVYLLSADIKLTTSYTGNYPFGFLIGNQNKAGVVSTPARNTWVNVQTIAKPDAVGSYNFTLYFTNYITYLSNGDKVEFRSPQVRDLTAMFGSTIADAIYTMETATAGSGVAFFRSLFPSDYYPYSASTLQSVQTSARQALDGNGNTVRTYPLDSDLVLRGIPKVTNGVLSYDGDIYLPTGEVTRRYGVATFDGSETLWGSETVSGILSFYIKLANVGKMQDRVSGTLNNGQCMANNFLNVSTVQAWQFTVNATYINFRVDSTITSVAEWKTWLGNHPQTILYPLATPTTESADPYTEVQLAGTTEQFVCDNYTPVGNETFYPTDLTGVVQNLAPLPTTAGTYKLQVTVSGGVPSYSWVAG